MACVNSAPLLTPVVPPPLGESMLRLEAKKAAVTKARRMLEDAREALQTLLPKGRAHVEREQARRAEEAADFLQAIRAVEV